MTRKMLAFAARYDPHRTSVLQVEQTMDRLGWDFNRNEMISDGLFVDFSMKDNFCAFEIVQEHHYVEPGAENASDAPAVAFVPTGNGRVLAPEETPFPAAPPAWKNPVMGRVLDRETAERHKLIRSKGWALVAIPQPLWELAASMKYQHYSRRDLLLSLTLPLAPFNPRPVALQTTTTSARQLQQHRDLQEKEAVKAADLRASNFRSRQTLQQDAQSAPELA